MCISLLPNSDVEVRVPPNNSPSSAGTKKQNSYSFACSNIWVSEQLPWKTSGIWVTLLACARDWYSLKIGQLIMN